MIQKPWLWSKLKKNTQWLWEWSKVDGIPFLREVLENLRDLKVKIRTRDERRAWMVTSPALPKMSMKGPINKIINLESQLREENGSTHLARCIPADQTARSFDWVTEVNSSIGLSPTTAHLHPRCTAHKPALPNHPIAGPAALSLPYVTQIDPHRPTMVWGYKHNPCSSNREQEVRAMGIHVSHTMIISWSTSLFHVTSLYIIRRAAGTHQLT